MFNESRSIIKRLAMHLILAAILGMIILAGCGGDDNGGDEGPVGSVSVSWSMECPEEDPLAFIAQIYDASNSYLTYGGPWACAANTGTVANIPIGSGRKILLFAENQAGAFVYRGEKNEINIEEAAITYAGEITTYSFVTALKEPYYETSGQDSIALILSWDYVTGAARYLIEIADNIDFSSPVVAETISGPPYYPESADLASGGFYYWRVRCIDRYDPEIQGAWSETLAFHPAPLVSIINPKYGNTYSQYQELVLLGSAVDAIDGRSLSGEPQWFLANDDSEDTPLCGYSGCEFSSASTGTYTLRLSATSQGGYTGSDSVTIHVSPLE
jgi:hypothetical protein